MMKRILHVVSSMNRGGQETLVMNVYRKIDRSKVQFDFLVSDPTPGDYDEEIRALGGKIYIEPSTKVKIPHLTPLFQMRELVGCLRGLKSDHVAVHFHNHHAYSSLLQVLPAKISGFKNVILHSHNTSGPHPVIHKLVRPILNIFSFKRFACSQDAAKWMFGNRRAQVVYNGIDMDDFAFDQDARKKLRKSLGLEEKKIILHIGRLSYQKNHGFLLDVFKKIHDSDSDAHLLLVGRGELEHDIRRKVSELELDKSVTLLGVREDIPALMSASDLFLFPSWFEGLSVVVVETQVNGLPILGSDRLSQEGLFSNSVTLLPLTESVDVWANVGLSLMKRGRRRAGSPNMGRFDIKVTVSELETFYSDLKS